MAYRLSKWPTALVFRLSTTIIVVSGLDAVACCCLYNNWGYVSFPFCAGAETAQSGSSHRPLANQVTNFRISSCPSLSHSPEVQPNFRDQASCCDRSKPSWKDAISNSEQPTQSTWYRSGPPALQQSYSCLTQSSSFSKPSPLSC